MISLFLKDLQQEEATGWRMFLVFLVGTTNGAHDEFVKKLEDHSHKKVKLFKDCDYVLMFCPIASRVGTDIDLALSRVPAGKPIILVVMHHTFNPEYVVADSRRLVTNLNVRLTVDCLFYEHRLLNCKRNDDAWSEVATFLRVRPQVPLWKRCLSILGMYCQRYWKWIICTVSVTTLVGVLFRRVFGGINGNKKT